MQAKGFFSSLFDYSFSSFITPKIIKVLYVLLTIAVSLWTLVFILLAFKASAGLGIVAVLIGGPIFFVIAMIYVRVALELAIVFFRIHEDVEQINHRGGGTGPSPAGSFFAATMAPGPAPTQADAPHSAETTADPAPAAATPPAPAPTSAPPQGPRFCENCGTERSPGKQFCTGCGERLP